MSCWPRSAVTLLLQIKWVSLSVPADPGCVFPPDWRPQPIFLLVWKSVFFRVNISGHSIWGPSKFQPTSRPCSIEKVSFFANGESLYWHLWCGLSTCFLRSFNICLTIFCCQGGCASRLFGHGSKNPPSRLYGARGFADKLAGSAASPENISFLVVLKLAESVVFSVPGWSVFSLGRRR